MGNCCHYFHRGIRFRCKHLIKLKGGKTLCRIYNKKDRIGTIIAKHSDKKYICNDRVKSGRYIEGCPFNK